MRIFAKRTGLVLILAVFCHGSEQQTQKTNPPFSIALSTAHDTISADTRVKVKAEVTNISAMPLIVSGNCSECTVEVREGGGNLAAETERHRQQRMALRPELRRFTIQIMPGETHKWVWVVSDIYDMSRPGQYFIQAGADLDGSGTVKSNIVPVTVIPPTQADQGRNGAGPSFSFEIDALQDIVKTGSEVVLRIETTATSAHAIDLDNSSTKYAVEVRDNGGILASLTETGRRHQSALGKGGGPRVHLDPGETKGTGTITLSDLYDFTRPGQYSVQLTRLDEETEVMVTSNIITITINP